MLNNVQWESLVGKAFGKFSPFKHLAKSLGNKLIV